MKSADSGPLSPTRSTPKHTPTTGPSGGYATKPEPAEATTSDNASSTTGCGCSTNLTGAQRTTIAIIAKVNQPLYRAYLLKEQLREVFAVKGKPGRVLLAGWLSWARRSRIPEFVTLAKTITRYLPLIHNTLNTGLGNARSEATNTHLRLLTRRAYGFHTAEALIAMATLTRGGLCPPLPGRT